MPLTLQTYTVGPLMENAYLLVDEDSSRAVLIDPGDEPERLLYALESQALTLSAIWLTHAHFDHIGAIDGILAKYTVPVLLHPEDKPLYSNAYKAAQLWEIPFVQPSAATVDIEDKQVLTLGNTNVHCLFTPGHAPGHIAFYLPEQQLLIAGDALFQGSIGRTDLPMGNHEQLIESIKTRLLVLPDDTDVYPGHGEATTIGAEKSYNPFLS